MAYIGDMTARQRPRPVVLCILDGWGHRTDRDHNAIAHADTPVWDRLIATRPHAVLDASGQDVGLPGDQMGNSEVGHVNLGAGRVVLQDLPRIDAAVADGTLAERPALQTLIANLRASGGTAHLMGLMSPGGVHAHVDHMAALARILADSGLPVRVHAFLDGRDTPPSSAQQDIAHFAERIADLDDVTIATVCGRYYPMDRDRRWDRVALAYAALVDGDGIAADTAPEAVAASYRAGRTDEFVQPSVIGGYAGMADGDGLVMANFRADRVRQILAALLDPDFNGFERSRTVEFAAAVGMTEYSSELNRVLGRIFPPELPGGVLGEIVSAAGLRQLRIAETEKYAHVTFFLSGGREDAFPGETRILVPSPKVATYDLRPEMSAVEVTDRLVAEIDSGSHDLVVVNYANADMVGHTGDMAAAVKAVETLDACLGRLERAVELQGGAFLITADHGNVELMRNDETQQPHTAHTSNLVPIVLAAGPDWAASLGCGRLADVAPTVLHLLALDAAPEMTGQSLITEADDRRVSA